MATTTKRRSTKGHVRYIRPIGREGIPSGMPIGRPMKAPPTIPPRWMVVRLRSVAERVDLMTLLDIFAEWVRRQARHDMGTTPGMDTLGFDGLCAFIDPTIVK